MPCANCGRHIPSLARAAIDVVKHINRVVDLAGIDSVGLGSDFDGVSWCRKGSMAWTSAESDASAAGRRYSQDEIIKIYGGTR